MSKGRITELAQKLREAAKLQDPVARAAIEMIQLARDAAKESLVGAEGDDMLRTQGAARHLAKLHTELTTTPPSLTPSETTR